MGAAPPAIQKMFDGEVVGRFEARGGEFIPAPLVVRPEVQVAFFMDPDGVKTEILQRHQ